MRVLVLSFFSNSCDIYSPLSYDFFPRVSSRTWLLETHLQTRSQPVSQGDGHRCGFLQLFSEWPLLPAPWRKPRLRDLDDAFPLPAALFPARRRPRVCSASVMSPLSSRPPCWLGLSFSLCLEFSAVWLRVSPLGVTDLLRVWVDFPCLSGWEKISQYFLECFAASFFFPVLLTPPSRVC